MAMKNQGKDDSKTEKTSSENYPLQNLQTL